MSENAYFDQAEQNIKLLIAEKKYKEAYISCKKFLEKFPDESRFIKLKEKIEHDVDEENQTVIEKKLNDIKPLWKQEKYVEILQKLRELLKISPTNVKIQELIAQAQESYKKEINKLTEDFEKKESEKFEELMEKDEKRLIDEMFLLEKSNPGNHSVLALTKKYRGKLIDKKIHEKEYLIYSDKFDDIANLISQLKKIDDKNAQINHLEKLIKTRKLGGQVEDKNEFIFKAEQYLVTLMKLKKYDKALQVAGEILEIDKSNKNILKIFKKAEDGFYKQTRGTVADIIIQNQPQLREEYSKNKDKFIKI